MHMHVHIRSRADVLLRGISERRDIARALISALQGKISVRTSDIRILRRGNGDIDIRPRSDVLLRGTGGGKGDIGARRYPRAPISEKNIAMRAPISVRADILRKDIDVSVYRF